jgi:REP element-mobilizing transposase RayT
VTPYSDIVILATHAIFTAYGFWLPNDPRGSWSQFVASWELMAFGRATTVHTRRSLARDQHDVALRLVAKAALKYRPVKFTGRQALSIAHGFATAVNDSKYVIYACSILPDHVHLVVKDHSRPVRRIVGHLKSQGTRQLRAEGQYAFASSTPWVQQCWIVYLDKPAEVRRAIRYVEENPVKERKRLQKWSFVTEYALPD